MKSLLLALVVLIAFNTHAQDCSASLLLKKGAQITYKTYSGKFNMLFQKKFFETTMFKYVVKEVKDSNGIKYSTIQKTGTNPEDPSQRYTRTYTVTCDGAYIKIPFGFYQIDTIYFSNIYPNSHPKIPFYISTVLEDSVYFMVPVNFDKNPFRMEGTDIKLHYTLRDITLEDSRGSNGMPDGGKEFGGVKTSKREGEMKITKVEDKGAMSVQTESGKSYDVHKILITFNHKLSGDGKSDVYPFYFNPLLGFVKADPGGSGLMIRGYAEVDMVRK